MAVSRVFIVSALCLVMCLAALVQIHFLQSQIVELESHIATHVTEKSSEIVSSHQKHLNALPKPSCPAPAPCPSVSAPVATVVDVGSGQQQIQCPSLPPIPACPGCPDCSCGGGGESSNLLPQGIIDGIISSFLGSVGDQERSAHKPLFLQGPDELGRKIISFENTEDCSIVARVVGSDAAVGEVKREVEVVAWLPPVLTDYDEVDDMSDSDLAVALGFIENHELVRGLAERRMDAVSKFKKREYAQLARAYGSNNDGLNNCFGAQMEMRDEIKQKRFILLVDHLHVSESGQSHNEIYKKCSSCANSAYCYTGGKESDSEDHHRLQQLADLLLRPTPATFHWLGRAQMKMLLKREIKRRQRNIETAIRWNLCHPAVSSLTLAVTDIKDVPPALSHSRFHVFKVHSNSVSYSDMVRIVSKKQKGSSIIIRADVILGEGVGVSNWVSDGQALALSPHQAAPSLANGVTPVSYCSERVGGEHTAIAFSLPIKETAAMAVTTVLPAAEGVFLKSMCANFEITNPCERVRVYHFSSTRYLRLHPQEGIYARTALQEAISCNPGNPNCCSLSRGSQVKQKDDASWNALMESGLYKLHSGIDEPFDPYKLGYAEADLFPFTAAVQKFLYDWQHPADCNSAKFMRAHDWGPSGIGSNLHTLAHSFGVAIDAGRVLVLNNAGAVYADDWCPSSDRNFGCFFLPLTHCPPESMHDIVTGDRPSASWVKPTQYVVPKVLERWLSEREVNVPGYYWWRGQAVAYLARFNSRMKEEIVKRRKAAWNTGVVVTPGTVSAHVRHGDKASEMRLVHFRDYWMAANTSISSRRMFISTEDPGVIDEAKSVPNWEMFWVDQRRDDTGPMQHAQMYGASEEFLSSILNLMIALECDSFVGTRGSNWNRLIDELRCIWSGRARATYIEVGDHQFGW